MLRYTKMKFLNLVCYLSFYVIITNLPHLLFFKVMIIKILLIIAKDIQKLFPYPIWDYIHRLPWISVITQS